MKVRVKVGEPQPEPPLPAQTPAPDWPDQRPATPGYSPRLAESLLAPGEEVGVEVGGDHLDILSSPGNHLCKQLSVVLSSWNEFGGTSQTGWLGEGQEENSRRMISGSGVGYQEQSKRWI